MKLEEMIMPKGTPYPGDDLNFVPWDSDQYGEMKSFIAFVNINTTENLEKYDLIKENVRGSKIYIELEVGFNSENILKDIIMLIQYQPLDEDYDDWTDPDTIGEQVLDQDGNIVGHTMLSEEEFSYLIDMATKAVREVYPNKEEDQEKD